VNRHVLLLGDASEWEGDVHHPNLAHAVTIRYHETDNSITIHTSIVGLPPIFVYSEPERVIVSSDIHLISKFAGVRLQFDPEGVQEFARIGHPVGHRTLFRNTTLVPSGTRLVIANTGSVKSDRSWRLPDPHPVDWNTFILAQVEAFVRSVRRMDVRNSFLSLTAGLDTRTVFATLASDKRLIPAVTMSGPNLSLDARTARKLSNAYSTQHRVVTIGKEFERELPTYVEKASLLSGGLASLRQAPEVFLYQQLAGSYSGRVTGNLGNQVGRGGTEGVSTRRAALEVLTKERRSATEASTHWLLTALENSGTAPIEFIIQQEIPFTLAGNFSIGSHFVTQKTPYADRTLIETLACRPVGKSAPSGSALKMRFRDLRHRFLGEPASVSFQRSLLRQLGGFAAEYPINFGWRATGGVSLSGLLWGSTTFAAMLTRKQRLDDGPTGPLIQWLGLATLHDFHRSAKWLREDLRDFTFDTITSRAIADAELFDMSFLTNVLEQHFRRTTDHYDTVAFALDLALAYRLFCAN